MFLKTYLLFSNKIFSQTRKSFENLFKIVLTLLHFMLKLLSVLLYGAHLVPKPI